MAQPPQSHLRDLIRGSAKNLIGGLISAGLTFGFTLLIARQLGPSGSGVYFQAIGVFSVLFIVGQVGASATIVKTVASHRAIGRTQDLSGSIIVALVPAAILSVVAGVALFVLAPELADALVKVGSTRDETIYLRIFSPFIPLATLSAVLLAATRALGSMAPTVVLDSIGKPLLRFAVAAMGMVVAFSPQVLGALWAVPVAIVFALSIPAVCRLVARAVGDSEVAQRTSRRILFREYSRFTAPQWLADVFQLGVLWIDIILLGALASSRDAGVYTAMSRVVQVGTLGLVALTLVLGPVMSGLLAQERLPEARSLYRVSTVWLTAASAPVFLLISAFAPLFARMFGSGFSVGSTALIILALAMLVDVVAGPALLTLLMGGRSQLILANTAAAFAANIGFNLVLIPAFGMNGAAVAWAISIILLNLLAVVQMKRLWGIQSFSRIFLFVAISAIVCFGLGGALSAAVGGQRVVTFVVSTTVELLIYSLVLWKLRRGLELGTLMEAARSRRA